MNMKRAYVDFQIEGSIEVLVPMDASDREIDRLASAAVKKTAKKLAADITNWDVREVEKP